MIDYNALAKEIHADAVAHGWWKKKRPFGEVIALIHSELSEALEEYRDGRPAEWYECGEIVERIPLACAPVESDCTYRGHEYDCPHRGKKPEGIAVELVDAVIRILDFYWDAGYQVSSEIQRDKEDCKNFSKGGFPIFIATMHSFLSLDTLEAVSKHSCFNNMVIPKYYGLNSVVICIEDYFLYMGWDYEGILRRKIDYNKTRLYRHGNKVC